MTGKIASLLAACLALAACSPPAIKCDANGMAIIPADAAADTREDLEKRNRGLIYRRYDKVTGAADWQTPESLAKADGCP